MKGTTVLKCSECIAMVKCHFTIAKGSAECAAVLKVVETSAKTPNTKTAGQLAFERWHEGRIGFLSGKQRVWSDIEPYDKSIWETMAMNRAGRGGIRITGLDMADGPDVTAISLLFPEINASNGEAALAAECKSLGEIAYDKFCSRTHPSPPFTWDEMGSSAQEVWEELGRLSSTSSNGGVPSVEQQNDAADERSWVKLGKPTGAFRPEDAKGYVRPVPKVRPRVHGMRGVSREMQSALAATSRRGTHILGTVRTEKRVIHE